MRVDKNYLLSVFKDPAHPDRAPWAEAQSNAKKLQMHVLGVGLDNHIEKINTYETDKQKELRKKYGKSNRDMYARVLRPRDYIWSAKGGGAVYMTASPAQEDTLKKTLAKIKSGYSLRDWLRLFWSPRYIDDPMGLMFLEVDLSKKVPVYPTYKASSKIFAGKLDGRLLEYVVFSTPDPTIFRVVDDNLDQFYKWKDETIQPLNSKQYPVYKVWFERVPACIISDIPRDGREDAFASPIQDEVEVADMMLREGSISNVYRFKFGFSRAWKYEEVCGVCNGTKTVGAAKCSGCNGSGKKLNSDPSDVMVMSWPDKDNPEIKDKGGYITPDLDYLKYADDSLDKLEDLIFQTHWGTQESAEADNNTATGRWIDTQPVENRLSLYAMAAERIEEWVSDRVGEYLFGVNYQGTTVNLGRRFLLESPDTLWTKYQDARKTGAPQAMLSDLVEDYLDTKLQGNDQEAEYRKRLIKLEPARHLTMTEANNNVPAFEYLKKVYFEEFVSTLSVPVVNNTPLEKLRDQLQSFTLEKAKALPPDPTAAAPGTADRNPAGGDPGAPAPGAHPAPGATPQPPPGGPPAKPAPVA